MGDIHNVELKISREHKTYNSMLIKFKNMWNWTVYCWGLYPHVVTYKEKRGMINTDFRIEVTWGRWWHGGRGDREGFKYISTALFLKLDIGLQVLILSLLLNCTYIFYNFFSILLHFTIKMYSKVCDGSTLSEWESEKQDLVKASWAGSWKIHGVWRTEIDREEIPLGKKRWGRHESVKWHSMSEN